jgi:hypothetical protein
LFQRDEERNFRALAFADMIKRSHVIGFQAAAFYTYYDLTSLLAVNIAEEFQAVDAAIRALLSALEGLGVDERNRPPLELVFVPGGEVARCVEVAWRADHIKFAACSKSILKPLFDQGNGEVGDVDPNPLAFKFLRGMNGGTATAEWIEHHVAFLAAGLNDAFEQGQRLLSGITEAFACLRVNRGNIVP